MLNKRFKAYLLFFLSIFFVFSSCSTEKNRFINRVYHGLLARDNGYFHAKLKMEEGAQKLAESHEDKFDMILSIFQYADAAKAKAIYPLMDEAIKKVSVVIQRQSMLIKGIEHNAWIDDNYLLLAQCQFYKHDYYTAAETFQYVITQYKKNDIRHEAMLWLIQTYIQLEDFDEAETRIEYVNHDKKFLKNLRGDLYIIMADFYLKKKNYAKAIEFLKKGIPTIKKRQQKTRCMFILAQLYQRQGKNKEATKYYLEVVKRTPSYNIAFNAQMNVARSTDAASKNTKNVKKRLTKMIHDGKNIEYYDQIYYALATISIKENDIPTAIKFLELSIKSSKTNTNQKALSYLELAKINFNKPNYELAQVYYDSTTTFLSKDYPDYEIILNKRNSLTALVKNIKIIAFEDSMQRLATLSPADRDKMIEKAIAFEAREKERKKAEALKAQQNALLNTPTTPNSNINSNNITGGAAWYFYNPTTISFGFSEFLKKWGDRKLEDNWRRKNKEVIQVGDTPTDTTSDANASKDTSKVQVVDKNAYLKNIPISEKQLEQSNENIMDAYNNLASIYKEQLHDYEEAIKALESLVKRYPDSKYVLQSYYSLYRLYLELNNTAKADYYKNLILTEYPKSEYAKIISNPNYLKDSQKRLNQLDSFYEETFNMYQEKKYKEVIARKELADSLFPASRLSAKFNYLKTLSIGNTQDVQTFENALKEIVAEYPKDPVSEQAAEILNSIKNKTAKIVPPPTSRFNANTDTVQFYSITFPNNAIDLSAFKAKLSDYNVKYFRTISLEVTNMFIDSSTQMVIVKSFENKKQAMDYFNTIKTNAEVFADLAKFPKQQFLITPSNFVLFFKEKSVSKYLDFFEKNYK